MKRNERHNVIVYTLANRIEIRMLRSSQCGQHPTYGSTIVLDYMELIANWESWPVARLWPSRRCKWRDILRLEESSCSMFETPKSKDQQFFSWPRCNWSILRVSFVSWYIETRLTVRRVKIFRGVEFYKLIDSLVVRINYKVALYYRLRINSFMLITFLRIQGKETLPSLGIQWDIRKSYVPETMIVLFFHVRFVVTALFFQCENYTEYTKL